MGVLATNNRQLIFIYSEEALWSHRLLAYVKTMTKPVRLINLNKERISDTIWLEIAAMLNVELAALFDLSRLQYNDLSRSNSFSAGDLLKIIDRTPAVLKYPIAINGTKAEIIKDQHQLFSFYNTGLAHSFEDKTSVNLARQNNTAEFKSAM